MGIGIPQVITETKASGAQVIDGSLRFDKSKTQYLKRTPSVVGNRRTWTISWWQKRSSLGVRQFIFEAGNADTTDGRFMIRFSGTNESQLMVTRGQASDRLTSAIYRDFSGWAHYVVAVDTTASGNDKIKVYKDGTQIEIGDFGNPTNPGDSANTAVNMAAQHTIGYTHIDSSHPLDSQISQYYLIDGQQLGPEEFGFTDLLTNTWRPKKYTGTFTTSSPNNGTTWTNNTTSASGTIANAYDGDSTTWCNITSGVTFTLTPPSTIVADTVEVWLDTDTPASFSINGGSFSSENTYSGLQYVTVATNVSLTSLAIKGGTGGSGIGLRGIRINGEVLLDGLNNTGVNSFYLPMDGNSPIGQDKSGNGNDFTPVNFGGSLELDNPNVSGARPILNTTQGGSQAGVGVFGEYVGFRETVSSSSGGGNPYIFDGRGTQPTLSFIRGATYVFDYSSATSHPLRFATAADAAGSTQYTNGTSVSGNVISFTVPHNAPDTLYYYCTNHGGMGNSISVTTDETKTDKYASDCVLALPYCGGESDVTSRLTTNSSIMSSWTANNATFEKRGGHFYSSSLYMSGSSDYPRINFSAGAMNFMHNSSGTGTVEFWGKPASTNTGATWASTSGGSDEIGFGIYSANNGQEVACFISNGTSGQGSGTTSSHAPTPHGKWVHIAMVKTPTQLRLYTDGVLRATHDISSYSFNNNNSTRTFIQHGSSIQQSGSRGWNGAYMSDFRVYEGIEKYTGTTVNTQYFVPPSASPDILPDTPSGVSGSSKLTKIIDGAVAFNGSTSVLDAGSSSDYELSDDHTIEAWIYSFDARSVICGNYYYTNGGQEQGWHFGFNSSNLRLNFRNGNTGTQAVSELGSVVANQWYHVAVVTSSGSSQIYIDGKASGSAVDIGTPTTSSTRLTVGGLVFASESSGYDNYFDGYISNLRIIKGTALYSGDFTPPARTLTNVTNTKLLTCQSTVEPGGATVASNVSGINNGTNWSHYVTGDIDSSFPAWRAFRNDTSSVGCRTQTASGATIVWQPPTSIAFSSSFKIWAARDGSQSGTKFTVTHAGGTTDFTSSVVTSTTQTAVDLAQISGVTSPITKITIVSGGPNPRFSGIEVDSVMLVDPLLPKGDSLASNFTPFNTIDTVRGQETGYCTLNANDTKLTQSNGNLDATSTSGVTWVTGRGTLAMPSGKFYWEVTVNTVSHTDQNTVQLGIGALTASLPSADGYQDSNAYVYANYTQQVANGGSATSYGVAYTAGDTVGVTFDADTGTLAFYVNGSSQGNAYTGLDATKRYAPLITLGRGGTSTSISANWGQKPFKFPPPDGFQPLNHANTLPETPIVYPDKFVKVKTYTGNGSTQSINCGFKPDFVWIRNRGSVENHSLNDSVRGANKQIQSSANTAETSHTNQLTSFDSLGFSVGSSNQVNENNVGQVAWTWKAGGNKNTFNVDDVGYASASDVNMSVGDLNSSRYDTSDTWSDDLSSPQGSYGGSSVTSAFNGSLTQGFEAGNPSGGYSTIRFEPASPITVNTQIRIHVFDLNDSNVTYQYRVNDGSWTSMPGTSSPYRRWQDLGFTGTLNSFEYRSNTSITYKPTLYAVEIDGKLLIDSGTDLSGFTQYPSIAATGCSVGTKQGFSIVKFTGPGSAGFQSVPHGLLEKPKFIICKDLDNARNWSVFHEDVITTDNKVFYLNNALAVGTSDTDTWDVSEIDASTFTPYFRDDYGASINADNIAYLWHDVPGVQKFGSYVGNNSTDGPYIELGFRPALLMVRRTAGDGDWFILDTTRAEYNPVNTRLWANLTNAESSSSVIPHDILSNGFKVRNTETTFNASGETFIYAAWAEIPTFNLYGAQSNAR